MNRPKRKAIPLHVKLNACLRLLGFDPEADEIEWDHTPALQLRPVDATGADYDPPQLDWRHIEPLKKADHGVKTTGRKGQSKLSVSGEGDVSRIAKAVRLEAARFAREQSFRAKVLGVAPDALPLKRSRPKAKIPSRPFPKRTTPR